MKKMLFILLLLASANFSYSQEWIESCESDTHRYFVYSRCRNADPYQYVVYVKKVPVSDIFERKKIAEMYGDYEKYRNYSYSKFTYIVDIKQYRSKLMDETKYDKWDKIIEYNSWSDIAEWDYAKPESILEGIIDSVKRIVISRKKK